MSLLALCSGIFVGIVQEHPGGEQSWGIVVDFFCSINAGGYLYPYTRARKSEPALRRRTPLGASHTVFI